MNDTNDHTEDVPAQTCPICDEPLGEEDLYFGKICPEPATYAHSRCVAKI